MYEFKRINYIEKMFRRNIIFANEIKKLINKFNDLIIERYGNNSEIKIMDFCGTHEWTITYYGIRTIIPKNIDLIAGPGCPVCVTPSYYIEEVIKLAFNGITVYTYGDVYRLPTVRKVYDVKNLQEAKALGANVKVVESFLQAIQDAKNHGKESIFVGIGFETIASGYAKPILLSKIPNNLKFLSLVKLTPPAAIYTIEQFLNNPIKGIIAPGHVSTITGAKVWSVLVENYNIPTVITGFEPIDVLLAITEILKQIYEKKSKLVIEYTRAVTWYGDLKAQNMIYTVFEIVDDFWRGIGLIKNSGLRLRDKFKEINAHIQYGIKELNVETWNYDLPSGCKCGEITIGKAKPIDCPLFMKVCKPEKPYGPCMVSIEGTCAIWARYGGYILSKINKILQK